MKRVGTILKRIGKVLLWIILVLVVLIGSFVLWLRAEPTPVTECEAGFRLIEHGGGADCVPVDVNKIVVLSSTITQFFVVIDQPVAARADAVDFNNTADVPGLYERFSEINEDVVDFGAVQIAVSNVELLLEVDPDVIVTDFVLGDFAKPLSLVAPVISLGNLESWEEVMLFSGDLINEREAAETLLAEYEQRIQILREQFDDPAAIKVSNARLFPGNAVIQLPNSFAGEIIREVGFSIPDSQLALLEESPDLSEFFISDERIDLIDGDFLIIYPSYASVVRGDENDPINQVTGEFLNDPLFQTLAVAQEDKVYATKMYWTRTGIYSAHAVLDDLFIYVAGVDPEEVAPNPLRLE